VMKIQLQSGSSSDSSELMRGCCWRSSWCAVAASARMRRASHTLLLDTAATFGTTLAVCGMMDEGMVGDTEGLELRLGNLSACGTQ